MRRAAKEFKISWAGLMIVTGTPSFSGILDGEQFLLARIRRALSGSGFVVAFISAMDENGYIFRTQASSNRNSHDLVFVNTSDKRSTGRSGDEGCALAGRLSWWLANWSNSASKRKKCLTSFRLSEEANRKASHGELTVEFDRCKYHLLRDRSKRKKLWLCSGITVGFLLGYITPL